jgi:hypothetical protein
MFAKEKKPMPKTPSLEVCRPRHVLPPPFPLFLKRGRDSYLSVTIYRTRFGIPVVVLMKIQVYGDVAKCRLLVEPDDGDTTLLRNVGNSLPVDVS